MTGLVSEREEWKLCFEAGLVPPLLQQYERMRDSELDRMSAAVKMVCEYALWLEDKWDNCRELDLGEP